MKIAHVAAFHKKGNAGDILLPEAVKKIVQRGTEQKIDWVDIQVRDTPDETTIEMINNCDLLIIGGGGLFLPDTNYNEISGWQWPISVEQIKSIKTPIFLRGVGFNLFRGQKSFNKHFNASILALVRKCEYVGLRNSGSIYAVREYLPYELHSKIILDPCPTTLVSLLYKKVEKCQCGETFKIAINLAFDREELRYGSRIEKLCADISEGIKQAETENKGKFEIQYFSHFNMDDKGYEVLRGYIPDIKYISLAKMKPKDIINTYTQIDLTIGTRGHAQLISFGCLTPLISIITHNKLQWFLDDIKKPEWGLDVSNIGWGAKQIEQAITNSIRNNNQLTEEMREVQKDIYKLLVKNSKKIFDHHIAELESNAYIGR